MEVLQVLEFVVAPALIALAAAFPFWRSSRSLKTQNTIEHQNTDGRLLKLETAHGIAYANLKEWQASNDTTLVKIDDKLDALTIIVARSGGFDLPGGDAGMGR